ncbi:hypothetical protein M0811_08644 [Anaeramoeba ignava]|uniref:Uncharacterized protein n=1 Tax=Anaeramoeba ignava TaxID=1746090 RepID=A0A9Q0RAW4_ANAIG|nr:hypothetical protein M0811_08644 [Anaeramoeba ignava]
MNTNETTETVLRNNEKQDLEDKDESTLIQKLESSDDYDPILSPKKAIKNMNFCLAQKIIIFFAFLSVIIFIIVIAIRALME